MDATALQNKVTYFVGHPVYKLDWGLIGTSQMYGIGSPPKKYKDTSSTLKDNHQLPLLKVKGCW